jgi:hypothetical protein
MSGKLGSDWLYIGLGLAVLYAGIKITKPVTDLTQSVSNFGSSIFDTGTSISNGTASLNSLSSLTQKILGALTWPSVPLANKIKGLF